jgi:hypothetical protein
MGYAPFLDTPNGDRGIAVPISRRHVLNIIPRTNRTIAVAREGKWWPIIERGFVDDRDHFGFLRALAYSAQRFVIAPNAEALGAHLVREPLRDLPLEPGHLGFLTGAEARQTEMAFISIIGQLSKPPRHDGARIQIDLNAGQMIVWEDRAHPPC